MRETAGLSPREGARATGRGTGERLASAPVGLRRTEEMGRRGIGEGPRERREAAGPSRGADGCGPGSGKPGGPADRREGQRRGCQPGRSRLSPGPGFEPQGGGSGGGPGEPAWQGGQRPGGPLGASQTPGWGPWPGDRLGGSGCERSCARTAGRCEAGGARKAPAENRCAGLGPAAVPAEAGRRRAQTRGGARVGGARRARTGPCGLAPQVAPGTCAPSHR